MRLAEHELKIREMLVKARVDSPGLCSRLLTAYAAGLSKTEYILAFNEQLSPEKAQLLAELAERRARGEPLAYILGQKEFYGLDYAVSEATLTPRPETELLIEKALELLPQESCLSFADLGCGCGCIGLTLLKLRHNWNGILLDNSQPALHVAAMNNQKHGLAGRILCGDIFNLPFACQSLDFIVSNPPYIGYDEIDAVMSETLAYEPHSALFSSKRGLAHIESVIEQSRDCLKPGGWLLVEHGYLQGQAVAGLMAKAKLKKIALYSDLAGLPRCVAGRK